MSPPISGATRDVLSEAVEAVGRVAATLSEGLPAEVDPVEAAESFEFHVRLFLAFHEQKHVDEPHRLVSIERAVAATRRRSAHALAFAALGPSEGRGQQPPYPYSSDFSQNSS